MKHDSVNITIYNVKPLTAYKKDRVAYPIYTQYSFKEQSHKIIMRGKFHWSDPNTKVTPMRQFIDTQGKNIQTITEGLKTPKTDNSTKSPVR